MMVVVVVAAGGAISHLPIIELFLKIIL